MFDTIWLLVVKNWKTTAAGLASGMVWVLQWLGVTNIPEEVITTFTAFLVSLGLIFAKDGNKTGLKEEQY